MAVHVKTRLSHRSAHGLDSTGDPWQTHAACGSQNPDLWETPTKRNSVPDVVVIENARYAINVCRACPVKQDCRDDAQTIKPLGTIRGGIPYTDEGRPMPTCIVCGDHILLGDPRGRYCERHDRYDMVRLGRRAA